MENFIEQYAWIALGVVMIMEYLIGISKIKSNSAIEFVLNAIKGIFGKKDKPMNEIK